MIWCYIASFVMRQTVRLFLQLQKICISHHDGVTSRLVLEEGPGIPVIKGYPEVIVETEGSVRKMQKGHFVISLQKN